ncbi:MAG TPA: rRNA maturation RNase YbeY [Longimicrobiales bacterium]|nr:rRNA maturation RNase YbeY [Longimicrobiales bacterium]
MPVAVEIHLGPALTRARRAAGGRTLPAAGVLRRLLARAVRATVAAEGHTDAEISVSLLADPDIAEMNLRYLGHSGPTDVISFALYEPGERPVGDVYVGAEQAVRQAREFGVSPVEELVRLVVHGTLHVLGHDHPEGPERARSEMWDLQERLVREVSGS